MNIGQYNHLKVNRMVDFGAYLDCGDGNEVLIPAKFIDPDVAPGDYIDVFVYTDSQDRLIATTEHPYAQVGDFAFLEVAEVNKTGAFLDWGLEAKQLLVPFSEQKVNMRQGCVYLVYVYLDNNTKRVVASAKTEKFIGNVLPHYRKGDAVKALVIDHTPLGYRCIVDNLHYGMIYSNEVYSPIEIEQEITAYVKNVRDDGKIDLTISDRADRRTNDLAQRILKMARDKGGTLPYSDKTDPEVIKRVFACSKKDFKKAIGHLYKSQKITISNNSIALSK